MIHEQTDGLGFGESLGNSVCQQQLPLVWRNQPMGSPCWLVGMESEEGLKPIGTPKMPP